MRLSAAFVSAALLLAACASGSANLKAAQNAAPVQGALGDGLIAFSSSQGLGVLDPASGKQLTVVPLRDEPYFRVTGPVWGPSASGRDAALYFTLHDLRDPESARRQGAVAYDWLFRADPFTGKLEPLAASPDPTTDGPVSLAASASELAFSVGCCGDYDVDLFRFGNAPAAPARQPRVGGQGWLVEAVSPVTGWLVLLGADGTWAWYDPERRQAEEFPVRLKAEDAPVAISSDDRLAAVSGGSVQVVDLRGGDQLRPLARTGALATTPASALAWNHDSTRLALAVNGGIMIVPAAANAGTPTSFLAAAGVTSVDWSAPLDEASFASVRSVPAVQPMVDALLAATALPAADDSVSGRARTKVYLWRYDLRQGGAASAVATVSNVTDAFLSAHPPLQASVLWHHWAASDWLLGGCYRYRAVVVSPSGSAASTISLGDTAAC